MRPVIVRSLVVCLALAMAPWFSGGQEPIAMLLAAGGLLLGTLLVWRQPQSRRLKFGPLGISFFLLMVFALLSLLWSANRYSTGLWSTQWIMAALAFMLAYEIAGEPKGRRLVLRAYLIVSAIFCLSALGIYMTSSYDRLTGLFYWPNPAAAYLIPAILLSLDRLRLVTGKKIYFWVAASCLFLASFLLTDSRAATLVLAFVVLVYIFVSVTNRAFWLRLLLVFVVGIVASYGLVMLSIITVQHSEKIAPGSRLAEVANGESESVSDRINYLESALSMWLDHPLLGTGAGTYGDVHPQYQRRVISASTNAHNLYVQTLSELGIVGALLLALVLVWLFSGILRGLVESPELLAVALGILGLLLHFGLDIDASYPALLVLAAILLGLVYRQRNQERVSVSWRWPAFAAVVLIPVVSLYQSGSWASKAAIEQSNGDYPLAAVDYAAAHQGIIYNPTLIDAEGIDYYTIAATRGSQTKVALALALDRARQAERLAPHDGQNYQLEGRVLTLEGHFSAAERAFRKALILDPFNHPEYALDLASVQLLEQDRSGALQTANKMIAQYPDTVVTNRELDVTLRPALGDLEALIGNVEYDQGDIKGAQLASQRSLHYDPGNLRGEALLHQLANRSQS
jgi:O-antigen ligase